MQTLPGNSQGFGSLDPVAAGFCQGPFDEFYFQGFYLVRDGEAAQGFVFFDWRRSCRQKFPRAFFRTDDGVFRGEGHQPLNFGTQLAHIPGPAVVLEQVQQIWRKTGDLLVKAPAYLLEKGNGQRHNIPFPVPQGGQLDLDGEEPEKEVLTETALLKLLPQVFVGGADDPEIILYKLVAAQAAAFAFLDGT